MAKRTSASKTPVRKPRGKKQPFSSGWRVRLLLITFLIVTIGGAAYHYRQALAYYFSFKSRHTTDEDKLYALRNFQVMSDHKNMVFGIDVSEYQGKINWIDTDSIEQTFPVGFVFIRATYGNDGIDKKFHENWENARMHKNIRGAYHYYRPDENSLEQAQIFIDNVKLRKGDFPPVLDIEKVPEDQSIDSLKTGLKRWIKKVESHYGVKPIIYCGDRFYTDFLEEEFEGYTLWIANYNFFVEQIDTSWDFWQFTDKGKIPGIEGTVDIDIFNGTPSELKELTIGN